MSYASPIKGTKPYWAHWGCKACGNVRYLPAQHHEGNHPYCLCNGGEYHWGADIEGTWPKMVPISVYVKQA